jgi:hypothetical protein
MRFVVPVINVNGTSIPLPDNYREWDLQVERDAMRMRYILDSRATDTTGQRHGCQTYIDEFMLRSYPNDIYNIVNQCLRQHFADIDDFSRRLALQGITLRPIYASGGTVRVAPTFVGMDFAALEQGFASVGRAAQELRNNFESVWPSEFPPENEPTPEAQTSVTQPKRKRLEAKPPSEAPAQLSVKPKPRKLRL